MVSTLIGWWTAERRRWREALLVTYLLRLSDHQLADIGLRRDQLQPDGIRDLDLPPLRPKRAPARPALRRGAIRPSLQGCG